MGIVEGVEQKSVVDLGLAHEGAYKVDEVQYINGYGSYNFKPNNNLPTHYKPALRNHENLSYGGRMKQGPRPVQNYHQNYAPIGFQGQSQRIQRANNQGHKRSQSFED